MTLPFVVIHDTCGKPAYYLTKLPEDGAPYTSSIARHLDGTPVEYGAMIVCESCGAPFLPKRENIRTV